MPISEKIIERIKYSNLDKEFKKLMLQILAEEDKGNYRFKAEYEKFVNEYLETQKKDGGLND